MSGNITKFPSRSTMGPTNLINRNCKLIPGKIQENVEILLTALKGLLATKYADSELPISLRKEGVMQRKNYKLIIKNSIHAITTDVEEVVRNGFPH